VNSLGCVNEGVLVQEYLQGTEYVVDTVSHGGKHKVIALWEYDRRPTNGAGFVLHGQRLMTADEPRAQELMAYMYVRALRERSGAPPPPAYSSFALARSLARSGTPCWTRSASRTGLDTGR
jgi:hypothetical protein